MILSKTNNYIFLKTTKTAGTSFEIALSKYVGPDDVVTPISEEDEATRAKLGYRGPQNYLEQPPTLLERLGLRRQRRRFSQTTSTQRWCASVSAMRLLAAFTRWLSSGTPMTLPSAATTGATASRATPRPSTFESGYCRARTSCARISTSRILMADALLIS